MVLIHMFIGKLNWTFVISFMKGSGVIHHMEKKAPKSYPCQVLPTALAVDSFSSVFIVSSCQYSHIASVSIYIKFYI